MFRIDDPTAAVALPTPETAGAEGYFTEGSPTAGTPATNVRGSWLNMIQEELRAIVVAGGLTPAKTVYSQVLAAIRTIIQTYTIGNGQTTQNVLASRAWSTTYTNSTGKPIFVNVAGSVTTTGAAIQLTVAGQVFVGTSDYSGGTPSFISSVFAIVPPGATYSAGVTTGSVGALWSWTELR